MIWPFSHLMSDDRPLLVGPWRSELGFEALYWVPWLQQWRESEQIAKERLFVVSRGGAGIWYDAANTADLYDYLPLKRLRQAMLEDAAQTGSVKQTLARPWESRLLAVIAEDLGLRRYRVIHPSVMYQALTPWWEGHMGLQDLLKHIRFAPLPVSSLPVPIALPERFVAVGFYARHTWPVTEESVVWVANFVDNLAKRIPVVVITSDLHADEHIAFPLHGQNIVTLAGATTPQTNISVQTSVLVKAQAFVGTYGGLMQLAVRLGKPALGFYTKFEGTAYAHKHLTEWLGVQQQTPVFIGRPDDAAMVKDLCL